MNTITLVDEGRNFIGKRELASGEKFALYDLYTDAEPLPWEGKLYEIRRIVIGHDGSIEVEGRFLPREPVAKYDDC